MDDLARRAYYAVARAFSASNNLNFDTEQVLLDLQTALNLDDDTTMAISSSVEQDAEVMMLKQYDKSITKANLQPQASLGYGGAAGGGMAGVHGMSGQGAMIGRPMQPQAQQPYSAQQQESPFSYVQPAAKKQKKGGGSLNPPVARGAAVGGGSSRPTPLSVSGASGKQKARSMPSTPQGGSATPAGGAGLPGSAGPGTGRSGKGAATYRQLGVSAESFQRVMQRGMQEEMEGYLGELNARERAIFTELFALNFDENSPDLNLNELHKELFRWYKLDQRQQELAQQLAAEPLT